MFYHYIIVHQVFFFNFLAKIWTFCPCFLLSLWWYIPVKVMSATSKPTYIFMTSNNPGEIKTLIVSKLMSLLTHFPLYKQRKTECHGLSLGSLRSGEQSITCFWCCRKKRGIDFQGRTVDSGQCQQHRILQSQLRPRKLGSPSEPPGDQPWGELNTWP